VVDSASIEVSRRLRQVKTDRLDGERLLAKLIRHHAGEREGWSVVHVPSRGQVDAPRLHRELERLQLRPSQAGRRREMDGAAREQPADSPARHSARGPWT
jgi:hypothetical protein